MANPKSCELFVFGDTATPSTTKARRAVKNLRPKACRHASTFADSGASISATAAAARLKPPTSDTPQRENLWSLRKSLGLDQGPKRKSSRYTGGRSTFVKARVLCMPASVATEGRTILRGCSSAAVTQCNESGMTELTEATSCQRRRSTKAEGRPASVSCLHPGPLSWQYCMESNG